MSIESLIIHAKGKPILNTWLDYIKNLIHWVLVAEDPNDNLSTNNGSKLYLDLMFQIEKKINEGVTYKFSHLITDMNELWISKETQNEIIDSLNFPIHDDRNLFSEI